MDGDRCAFGGLVLLGVPLLLLLLGAHYYRERREKSRVASGEGRKGLGCFSLSSGSFKVLLH
jgi:hypothetical protein